MQIVIKNMINLNNDELKQLNKLHLKGPIKRSAFKMLLRERTYEHYLHDIYLLKDNETIIGWATCHVKSQVCWFYVQSKMRRQGFGKLLFETVKKDYPGVTVQPHSVPSTKFFKAIGAI